MLAIETVAVLGNGASAHDCAILTALAGCAVRLRAPAPEALDLAFDQVRFRVDVAIEHGLLTRSDRQRILDGILFTPDLVEAATGTDLVIDLEVERAAAGSELGRLVDLVRATAALAAPSVEAALALAGSVRQPGRVLALSVDRGTVLTRLSVLATPATSRHTLEAVEAFASRVNARGRQRA
jgi:3-hydroxyacyl-CoA dehydrogenase